MDSDINDRLSNYEELIATMQEELCFYKQEHVGLRNEVFAVVDDNKRLSEQAKKTFLPSTDHQFLRPDQKLDEIAGNLQGQIRMLVEENQNLDNIWKLSKDTIAELEREIIQYRELLNSPKSAVLQLKEDYEKRIRELETQLKRIMDESERVRASNNEILSQKLANDQKINELLQKLEVLNARELRLSEQQIGAEEMQRDNRRLMEELDRTRRQASDSMRREKDALQKMQEALGLAEAAAERKEAADQQFLEIREEYDKLVQVLGDVMRDAGKQVEEKVQRMKGKYKEQIGRMQVVLDRSLEELKRERETRQCISEQAEELQRKLMDALKGSQLLDQDLYEATQNIVGMELKIGAFEEVIRRNEIVRRVDEKRISDLEGFLQENRLQKGKWCETLDEITDRFQAEFDQLKEEVEEDEEGS